MNDAVYFEKTDLVYYQDRLDTFKDWPQQIRPDKYSLARAGFYYKGQADKVTCFACNVTLTTWEPKDNPWEQHLKWSDNCLYLKIVGLEKEDKSRSDQNAFGGPPSFQPPTIFPLWIPCSQSNHTPLNSFVSTSNKPYWPCWRSETKK